MKSKSSYPFTLKDISELLDLKLGIWSDKIKLELGNKIKQSETGIIAEMDKRFAEVDKRFDQNDDAHQEIIGALDEIATRKIKDHCQKYHGVVV